MKERLFDLPKAAGGLGAAGPQVDLLALIYIISLMFKTWLSTLARGRYDIVLAICKYINIEINQDLTRREAAYCASEKGSLENESEISTI
jgi:hypothetical protein